MDLPSGKRLHNYGQSPFLMGKSTWISIVFFVSRQLLLRSGWMIGPSGTSTKPKLLTPRIHMCNSPQMVNHWDGTHYWLVVSNIGLVWGFMMINDG